MMQKLNWGRLRTGMYLTLLSASSLSVAQTQNATDAAHPSQIDVPAPAPDKSETLNMFPHWEHSRFFIGGQTNIIFQAHGPFHSPTRE